MESLLVFFVALLIGGILIGALAWAWAKSRYSDGKSGAEGDLIKDGVDQRKRAEDAAAEERRRLEKEYL